MTALKEFQRLESCGLWRASPDAQRRDVIVSFGDATLVIADGAGRPLSHWSLPAVSRENPNERPAIYAPDADASETLEIDDEVMIDAIEKVRRAVVRARPTPGKLRQYTTVALFAGLAGLAVFWLPGALTQQTLSVVPASKRAEIGATLLGLVQRVTGPSCREPLGMAAAARLKSRLFGANAATQIVVMPNLPRGAVALPGGIVLLDRSLVEMQDDPAVAAGYIIMADTARQMQDPLAEILSSAGLRVTFSLLTTGEMAPETLGNYAQVVTGSQNLAIAPRDILAGFDAAQVPSTPYALANDPTGVATRTLITNDPMDGRDAPIILSDSDWVALQGICTN